VVLVAILVAVGATGTVAAQSAPDCSTVTYNGDGTSANPYEVSNLNQLQCIEDRGLNLNYRLVSDIDATETAVWDGGRGFKPIGDVGARFNRTFDGAGHELKELTIDRPSTNTVGLFGSVSLPGDVRSVIVRRANVTSSRIVGALVGFNGGESRYSVDPGRCRRTPKPVRGGCDRLLYIG